MKSKKTKKINVRVSEEIHKEILRFSTRNAIELSQAVRLLMREGLMAAVR